MGLLTSLFGGRDPSDRWPSPAITTVVLDLREKSICGARLGRPAAEIERIGRPREPQTAHGRSDLSIPASA